MLVGWLVDWLIPVPSGDQRRLTGETSDIPWLSKASAPIAAACNVVAHICREAAVACAHQGDPKETWAKMVVLAR